jgi:DNA repair exonuclease SbcCD ATPase subunit
LSAMDNLMGDVMEGILDGGKHGPKGMEPDPVAEEPAVETPVEEQAVETPVEEQAVETPVEETVVEEEEASPVPLDVLGKKKPADEPKPDPDDDGDDEPPAQVKSDPKANKAWQKHKADKKALKLRVQELEAAVEQSKNVKAPDVEEIAALQTKIEEYEAKLGQYDLAATQAFQQRFDAPIQAALRKGASLLTRGGMEPDAAKQLMQKLSDPSLSMDAIQEAVTDLPYAVQGAVVTAITEYGELANARNEALAHWKETRAAVGEQANRQAEISLLQNLEKDTAAAVEKLRASGNWMYQTSEDNPDWNKTIEERITLAKGILRSATPETLVEFVLEGATARDLRGLYMQAQQLADKRKAELDKLVKGGPKIGGGGGTEPAPTKKKSGPQDVETILDDIFSKIPGAIRGGG